MKTAFWNTFFGLFFVVLVLGSAQWLEFTGRFTTWVPLGDFFLMALAIFRLIRLSNYDLITKFLRDWLTTFPKDTFMGTLGALIACPWCIGLWWSFFVVFFYYAAALAWPVILILALAALASTLQLIANLLGWSAEAKKREVLEGSNTSGSISTCG